MSAKAVEKTNAMRALDRGRVAYTTHTYDPAIKTADGVAEAVGLPAARVFKTLVMLREGERRPLLVMAPGDREVNPRVLAAAVGAKSVRMAPRADAERMTGLQTGGIGALALLGKPFDVYIDSSALEHDTILVNGGRRGLNLELPPADVIRLTGARVVPTA